MTDSDQKQEMLVLKDGDDNVYRIPWSEIKKYLVDKDEASRRIEAAKKSGGLTEAIGGCINRPCVN